MERLFFRGIMVRVCGMLSLVLCVTFSAHAVQVRDQAVADAVEDRIQWDGIVPLSRLLITSEGGVVTLSGAVDNYLSKERAVLVAETVPGVQSVVDRIEVRPVRRSDAEVEQDVARALKRNSALKDRSIAIAVADATVSLSGTVGSWQERSTAEHLAKSVRGVRYVKNDLAIEYAAKRSDQDIESDVEQALKWDVAIRPGAVNADVEKGKVMLRGTVRSAANKRRAGLIAWVTGVKEVDATGIVVEPAPQQDRPRKEESRSDADIKNAVLNALQRDFRTSNFAIIAEVADRVVTLRGVVENLEAKMAAEEDARNVAGVLSVKNRLRVFPTTRYEDRELAEEIRQALETNPYLYEYDFSVSVTDGIASLRGTVRSTYERAQAAITASKVDGVVDVIDRMFVLDEAPCLCEPGA